MKNMLLRWFAVIQTFSPSVSSPASSWCCPQRPHFGKSAVFIKIRISLASLDFDLKSKSKSVSNIKFLNSSFPFLCSPSLLDFFPAHSFQSLHHRVDVNGVYAFHWVVCHHLKSLRTKPTGCCSHYTQNSWAGHVYDISYGEKKGLWVKLIYALFLLALHLREFLGSRDLGSSWWWRGAGKWCIH